MVRRRWSATVMLETVPGILALLGRTAPRRPQRFSKPPPTRMALHGLKSPCDLVSSALHSRDSGAANNPHFESETLCPLGFQPKVGVTQASGIGERVSLFLR